MERHRSKTIEGSARFIPPAKREISSGTLDKKVHICGPRDLRAVQFLECDLIKLGIELHTPQVVMRESILRSDIQGLVEVRICSLEIVFGPPPQRPVPLGTAPMTLNSNRFL